MSAPARQAPGLAQLEAVLAAGGPRLARGLTSAEARLSEIGESQGAKLGRHAAETLSAGGKRLRPLIVFLCAGDGHDNGTVRAAVAVPVITAASLVPVIVTVSTWLVPSAVATVIESV